MTTLTMPRPLRSTATVSTTSQKAPPSVASTRIPEVVPARSYLEALIDEREQESRALIDPQSRDEPVQAETPVLSMLGVRCGLFGGSKKGSAKAGNTNGRNTGSGGGTGKGGGGANNAGGSGGGGGGRRLGGGLMADDDGEVHWSNGGGKNGAHKNLQAKLAAMAHLEAAQAALADARQSGASKKDKAKLERQVKHWQKKVDETGENHSRRAKF